MIRYYVKSQNIFISNYLERNFEERDVIICGTNWYDKETGRHLMSQQLYSNITNERYLLGEETDKDFNVLLTKETPKTEKMSAINNISAASKARQLGTCVFLSVMGYEYFLTLGRKDPSVELFQIEGGDHAFLVVGRNVQSKEDDYQNWGKDTLVCDLWADKIFLASEIEEKLDNYVGCDTNTLQTTLQRFNPAVQRLKRMSLQ